MTTANIEAVLRSALEHYRAGDVASAREQYEAILAVHPDEPNALHLLGVLHSAQGRLAPAIACMQRALEVAPNMAGAAYNLGNALSLAGDLPAAIGRYGQALAIDPRLTDAWLNKGDAERSLRRFAAAAASYRQAIAVEPGNRHLWVRLGATLRADGKLAEAEAAYRQALQIDPAAGDANFNIGNVLFDQNRFEEALAHFDRASRAHPPKPAAAAMMLSCARNACNWQAPWGDADVLERMQDQPVHPLTVLTLFESLAEQFRFAARYAQQFTAARVQQHAARRASAAGGRIRIGYLSADFHEHATSYLMAELFERHDRRAFEVIGISYGPDDASPRRRRVLGAFERVLDIAAVADAEATARIAALELDILVDLKGYTKDARPQLVMNRPAPVVVSYLGFPGTLASTAVDYIIGDPVVLPMADQPYYSEKIVQLPYCYQSNDSTIEIDPAPLNRTAHGLPESGFVFCSFNGNQKITPAMFGTWMRILAAVEGSVLWTYCANPAAAHNLRREATRRGIDAGRLVFAPSLPHNAHLARYRLAGLFLDTAPYTAHTTASDALRSYLPLLTLRGTTFAGRVAASLLACVGVPELAVDSLERYEETAIALASNPAALAGLRDRIRTGVESGPLYDTAAFARHLEAVYRHMHEHASRGAAPLPFALRADGTIAPG